MRQIRLAIRELLGARTVRRIVSYRIRITAGCDLATGVSCKSVDWPPVRPKGTNVDRGSIQSPLGR